MTRKGRYDELGITGVINSYSKKMDKDSLCVVDVGCATGAAMYDCQQLLANRGICLETTGVDQSSKVEKAARKNLDRFIRSNVLCAKIDDGSVDIVICANMLRYNVSPKEKIMVIKKCTGFLKPTGILILDLPDNIQFGCPIKKEELGIYKPTLWRKLMRCILESEKFLGKNLLKEIKVLRKIDAEKFSDQMGNDHVL